MTARIPTATAAGLLACNTCGQLAPQQTAGQRCSRCGAHLHARRPDSLARTWALALAAALLYLPANLLPVMNTSSLFGAAKDTILSGIVYFWTSGSKGLAVLIFSVSILIPLLKLATLALLAFTVQHGIVHNRRERLALFRIIEVVGRWSMLDIFVVALMVGLVRFKTVATIEAGPGAAAFGAVVVLTMLAARSFDPRLLWDDADTEAD